MSSSDTCSYSKSTALKTRLSQRLNGKRLSGFRRSAGTFAFLILLVSLGISAVVVRNAGASNGVARTMPEIDGVQPVTVTASAGTPGPTPYATLGLAIDAINAGVHQGAIVVNINATTAEAGAIVLNSSGAGSAAYTAITIRPTADALTVAGPTVAGRGLIELNGADNVTIDGDNPNTGGTNRNLTIQNTAVSTIAFTSVIRIALATSVVTSADNCTIRNLNLIGNATGRNIAAATSTTGSENATFGVLATGGASTVSATNAPAAIAAVATVIGAGATANNLAIDNNSIQTVARGVAVQGSATTVFPGLAITGNLVGNSTPNVVDQVYSVGITAQGSANGSIALNTVYIEGFLPSSTSSANRAIDVGGISATGTFTIERNQVNRAKNNNTGFWLAHGINLGGGNNHVVRNNFVSNVTLDTTSAGFYSTTFNAVGIRVAVGTGHQIYHNSVNMNGTIVGATPTITAAFMLASTTSTGVDVRNNIFVNTLAGAGPTSAHVSMFLPSAASATLALTLNNNDYFNGAAPGATNGVGQVGTAAGTGFFTQASFDPTMTTPGTNFRSYTSTLSAGGTNDSLSLKVDPQFVGATDLHIAVASPMVNQGASVGVFGDIDGQARVPPPDIGADEPSGITPPPNDIAATAVITPAPSALLATGTVVSPQASFTNAGSAAQTNVMVQFDISGPGGYSYTNTQVIAAINPNQTQIVTFTSAPAFTTVGTYNTTATVVTPDANGGNNLTMATFQVAAPVGGAINVGTGETFTSLTNPGGIFDALNGLGASSNVTVNLTTDLTAETGTISLNPVAGGFTVTIQPNGARTISGANATALINLNGADGVTINGVNGAGNSLLIRNTGAGSTIRLINDSSNNSIQNCTIEGAGTAVVLLSTGTASGNDNNSIAGNTIRDRTAPAAVPAILISSIGTSAAIANSGTAIAFNNLINFTTNGINLGVGNENVAITNNEISQTANRTTAIIGINVISALGANNSISQNSIHDLRSSVLGGTFINTAGMFILDSRNMTVSRNRLYNFTAVAGATGRIVGIEFEGDAALPSSCVVVNNMVTIITQVATAQSVFGIFDFAFGGNTFTADYNTVYLGGTASGASNSWAFCRGAEAPTFYTARNNIAFNDRTGGTGNHFGSGDESANTGTYVSNFNFFAGTGATTAANFMDYGLSGAGTPVPFATWQAGPPARDANSVAGPASTFNAANFFVDRANGDLHLLATATPVLNAGTPLGSVTTDFDGQPRSATTPDIGADELVVGTPGTLQFSSATYSVNEGGGTASITVSRTGGTSGTVAVDYATVAGGSATGGAACTAGVDYINASGTLTFGDGVTSQSFNVTICNDASTEPDETVNLALSNVTGGATLGSPNTAVLTINDNDSVRSLSIDNATKVEGNAGTSQMVFTVTLSGQIGPPVSVHYSTADGTAVGGSDYVPIPDTVLNFNPTSPDGSTLTANISVSIIGDIERREANETFFVNLSMPTNANIVDAQGVGIIIDDDRAYISDIDHDRISDFVVFRPSQGIWFRLQSSNGFTSYRFFGTNGDRPVPGDYDGDGTMDLAVFRPSNATWYIERSSDFGFVQAQFGLPTDVAVQGDYDGDGKTDIAVFRNGNWYAMQSSKGTMISSTFGTAGDKAVPGDYDGDARTDLAVYRNGAWYILRSRDGAIVAYTWGNANDKPVPADYDGDGSYDIAVFRDGQWYIIDSLTGNTRGVQWGLAGDVPVMADYDGNGTTDIAVFRNGDWYVLTSDFTDASMISQHWGQAGDLPAARAYVPEQ
jgi:hypothetical protein